MQKRAVHVRFPLQTRIALLVTLLLVVTTLVLSWVSIRQLRVEKRREVERTSDAVALFVGNLMVTRLMAGMKGSGILEGFVDNAPRLYPDAAFLAVVDDQGAVEYGRLNPSVIPTADAEEERIRIAQYAAGGAIPPGITSVTLTIAGPPQPMPKGGTESPELGRVRVGFSLRAMAAKIRLVTIRLAGFAGAILAIGVLVSYLLGRRISRPLRNLAGAMEAI